MKSFVLATLVATSLISFSTDVSANKNPLNVQLATSYHPSTDISLFWVSEKLDGVRAYWDGKTLYTRSGNKINAPAFFTKNWPNRTLEGELWIDRGRFEHISAIIRNKQAKDYHWQQVKFMMFDLPKHAGTFTERISEMKNIVLATNNPILRMIEQYRVNNNHILTQWLEMAVAEGGEGLMLHKGEALYNQGRTANVMKLKPFFDADAQVIAHIAGKGKYLNKLGALLVKTDDGHTFKIGSGLSDLTRNNPPPIGSVITYKYSGKTHKGVPRFASFLRTRHLAKVN